MTEHSAARAALQAGRARTAELAVSLECELARIVAAAQAANGDDEHDPEGATIAYERQHTAALLDGARDRLADIDAALLRLDGGRYGSCERCGQPIGVRRLAARPAARYCTRCAGRSRAHEPRRRPTD